MTISRVAKLILTEPSKIIVDDIAIFLLLFFRENKALHFMGIICLTGNSYEMPSLIFSEK